MSSQEIRIVIYIKSTAKDIWNALTNPEKTEKYWGGGTRIESDWQCGSKIKYHRDGEVTDEHTVIESESPFHLSHTFEPKFGDFQNEKPSRVSFELRDIGNLVRLTIVHDDFQENSKVYLQCRNAWPMILSSLKTLLETGEPLPEIEEE